MNSLHSWGICAVHIYFTCVTSERELLQREGVLERGDGDTEEEEEDKDQLDQPDPGGTDGKSDSIAEPVHNFR